MDTIDTIKGLMILKEGKYSTKDIVRIKRIFKPKIVDIYLEQLKELSGIKFRKILKIQNKETFGDWVYYPWNNLFLHTLSEKENYILRTNRNKNLITDKEQKKLLDFTIAIAGLSVGGNIATVLLHNGFPKKIKLADYDILQTTNLNRVQAKLFDVGEKKIDVISRELYEIDPYVKITAFPQGLSKKNLKDFIIKNPKPKLVFEIIDDLEMKILLRKVAKKHKVPVVMLTSLGDSVLIDIERYDTEPKTKIFNGIVDEKKIDNKNFAVNIVGRKNIPKRALESIKEIGKTLVGRPQLMSTVTVASGIAVFIARKIALGEKISSGRTLFKFDDLFFRRS
jgi:molybdopterin/thiamine biosynthesis adenylyltransferase